MEVSGHSRNAEFPRIFGVRELEKELMSLANARDSHALREILHWKARLTAGEAACAPLEEELQADGEGSFAGEFVVKREWLQLIVLIENVEQSDPDLASAL